MLIVHKFSEAVSPLIIGDGLFDSLFLENLLTSDKLKIFGLPQFGISYASIVPFFSPIGHNIVKKFEMPIIKC